LLQNGFDIDVNALEDPCNKSKSEPSVSDDSSASAQFTKMLLAIKDLG
jgi:hypothetical protein